MNAKTKIILLIITAVVMAFVLLWLFNTCAYYFWLAGQQIDQRVTYLHRLYLFIVLFVLSIALEVFIIYKAITIR